MENSSNKQANNKKKNYTLITLIVIGIIAILGGFAFYAKTSMPIHNADSTMLPNKDENNYIKKTYGKEIDNLVNDGWTGRNSDIVKIVNKNKLSEATLNESERFNIASPYGFHINKGGRVNTVVSLYGNLTYLPSNKTVNVDDSSKTNSPDVSTIHLINKGKKDILVGTPLINQKYLHQEQATNYSNVTIMTMAAQKQFLANEKNIIKKSKDKNIKGIWYKVIPVYLDAKDVLPVGFKVSGIAYSELPNLSINNKTGKLEENKGKHTGYEFNYYLKNVQEGYKINYKTGKVSFN